MSLRLRPTTRPRRRFNLGDEDRRTFLLNAAFVGVIGGLVVVLIAAIGFTYWEQNLRPVARVGGVEIPPGLVADRVDLLSLRIDREQRRLRQAVVDQEIDDATAAERQQQLDAQLDEVQAQGEEGLIDLIFQSQLAAARGITVTEADVDARLAEQIAGSERRHVHVIVVETEIADEDAGATYAERTAARERAEAALAELQAGTPFAEVAAEYSTDGSGANGGDLGFISRANELDLTLLGEVFDLESGAMTDVVRGADNAYRIGMVSEIRTASAEQSFYDEIVAAMSLERFREFMRWEAAAEKLRDDVVDELMGGQVEQIHLAHIRIDSAEETGEDTEAQGEVHYSEILVAPNDEPEDAPELPEDDPAWAAARTEAEQIHAELAAITDPVARLDRFKALAREKSDSDVTAIDGGDAGFVTRGLQPEEVDAALFDTELAENTLLAPVRAENAYYVLWFHERRATPAQRLEALKAALALPDADFAALAEEYSDDDASKAIGGDIGWWTRVMLDQVDEEVATTLFGLAAGTVSEAQELGSSNHIFKILEKQLREHDADQRWFLQGDAFDIWYSERKDEAEANDVIVRAGEDDDPGVDEPTDEPTITPGATPSATGSTSPTTSASPSATPAASPSTSP